MIGFFAVVLLVCTIQMLQKKSYDAYILYAGPNAFTAEQENALGNALKYVVGGFDENGKTTVNMTKLIVMSEQELEQAQAQASEEGTTLAYNYETRQKTLEQFNLELMTGNSYLCFMSRYMYEKCADNGRFVPLSDLVADPPAGKNDEYSVVLGKTEYGQYFSEAFSCMGEEILVCLRRPNVVEQYGKKALEEYRRYEQIMVDILNFTVQK